MVSDVFIEEVLDMIADELVGGNPARALAQLNILLQKLEPLQKTHLFSIARTLLYISRALHLLGAPQEAQNAINRATMLLERVSPALSREHAELFLSLAEDLAQQKCLNEARHFADTVLLSLATASQRLREDQFAELLQRHAKVMELCNESELAHISRIFALLSLHIMSGFDSEVAIELIDSELFTRNGQSSRALHQIQKELSNRLKAVAA